MSGSAGEGLPPRSQRFDPPPEPGAAAGPVIALTTDFGLRDWYVGMMKAVLAARAPEALVIDLTHEVPPHAIESGAFALHNGFRWFPPGTVHLAVVDPGVGSARPAVAVSTGGSYLVGPDNGLLAAFADAEDLEVVELDPARVNPGAISPTFEGRDLFAPAAARLATGARLEELGELRRRADRPEGLLERGRPWWYRHEDVLVTSVLWIDRFGNCITGLPAEAMGPAEGLAVEIGDHRVEGLHRSFSDVARGEALMYIGSSGTLEIAVREGDAAAQFSIEVGTELRLRWGEPGGDTT